MKRCRSLMSCNNPRTKSSYFIFLIDLASGEKLLDRLLCGLSDSWLVGTSEGKTRKASENKAITIVVLTGDRWVTI